MRKIITLFSAFLMVLSLPILVLAEEAIQPQQVVDLTPLFQAIIGITSVLITGFLVPWLKTKFSSEQLAKAQNWVQIGVYAAEKLYGAGNGDTKLAYVEALLAQHRIRLDTQTLKALVDSEIKRMEQDSPAYLAEAEIGSIAENDEIQSPVTLG